MIGFGDHAVFMNPSDFGTPARLELSKGVRVVTGIFTNPSSKIEVGGGFIQSSKTTLLIDSNDAVDVVIRDRVTVINQNYLIVDIEHDGYGFCRLTLSRTSDAKSKSAIIEY